MALDRLLRGDVSGQDAADRSRGIVVQSVLLGAVYGVCMGLYAVINRGWEGLLQMLASACKVPLLFLLTLAVTFPSLYVFSALLRAPLRPRSALRLISSAIAVNLAVLASLGPIVAFFTLSTRSYPFMVLLNVLMFTISGFIGLGFLVRALRGAFAEVTATGASPTPEARSPSRWLFRIWLAIFSIVGAQMGWILRPFVGNPDLPFTLFRETWSNFFAAVIASLGELLG